MDRPLTDEDLDRRIEAALDRVLGKTAKAPAAAATAQAASSDPSADR
jgi:hypothetical protein